MSNYCIVTTTSNSKEEANSIVQKVLEKKLAACIQSYEIRSSYIWEGKIEDSLEYRLDIKTTLKSSKELISYIKSIHSYTIPEIVVTPIVDGNIDYFKWIDEALN